MTILQLTNAYGPRTGGIRTHIDSLRPLYHARGHTAALVVPAERDEVTGDRYGPVIRLRAPELPINPDYRNLWSRAAVERAVAAVRPDVIELLDKWTLPRLARRFVRAGIPTLGFSCERLSDVLVPYLGRSTPARTVIRAYNHWFARQFRTVVCHSRYAAAELEAAGARNVVRVPLGVDLQRFTPAARDEALRAELLGDGERLAVYVGRLVPEKNAGLLAAAMPALAARGLRLAIAGGGPAAMEAALATAPGVRMLGFLRDRDVLARLVASADVFVFPSVIETFALSVLEALACGCPVAACDGGAVAEVVPAGAGVLGPATPAGLAGAVAAALSLDRTAAGAAGRATAEAYSWDATADAILALHAEALAR